MARAKKGSSKGKSRKGKPNSGTSKQANLMSSLDPLPELLDAEDPSKPMADRYYELAETMNARGAIELAVPFYRQALTLLLEERIQLRQLGPGAESCNSTMSSQAEIQGLIPEVEQLNYAEFEARIAELAEELSAQSARQVLVGLEELLRLSGSSDLPAQGHSLQGKAHLLLKNYLLNLINRILF